MGSVLALDELLDQRLEDELDEIAGFLNAIRRSNRSA